METQMGEHHGMISYIYQEFIHRKDQLTNSPSKTGRRIQPPILRLQHEGIYNSLILWIQPEGGYNPRGSLTPTGRWLQPPSS
jgi:hypothetical protein